MTLMLHKYKESGTFPTGISTEKPVRTGEAGWEKVILPIWLWLCASMLTANIEQDREVGCRDGACKQEEESL